RIGPHLSRIRSIESDEKLTLTSPFHTWGGPSPVRGQPVKLPARFTVDIDTRKFGAFSRTGYFGIFTTLDVGNRGAHAIKDVTGARPLAYWGQGGQSNGAGKYLQTFYFDKMMADRKLPDGTMRYGAWMSSSVHWATVPPEIIAKLMIELDEMIVEQGLEKSKGPIDPWICIPHCGLLSTDPDYDPADSYAIQSVNVMLNGNAGFPPLPERCDLLVEHSNELWNPQTPMLWTRELGWLRWKNSFDDRISMA